MADMQAIAEALAAGDRGKVEELCQQALDEGVSPQTILNEGLIGGMNIIGPKFKRNEVYVPEVLIAARAMHAGMGVLEQALIDAGVKPQATVVLGTVKGDLHDIGKNLVGMMLTGAGLNVVDIGIDAESDKFVEACKENNADLCAMSALLTTTMPRMKEVIEALNGAGVEVKTLVGGAPVTQNYADEIGASGYAADAASAADVAKELVGIS
jgi:5-methyltetrahydrofolate--homocysteine methyltransferase